MGTVLVSAVAGTVNVDDAMAIVGGGWSASAGELHWVAPATITSSPATARERNARVRFPRIDVPVKRLPVTSNRHGKRHSRTENLAIYVTGQGVFLPNRGSLCDQYRTTSCIAVCVEYCHATHQGCESQYTERVRRWCNLAVVVLEAPLTRPSLVLIVTNAVGIIKSYTPCTYNRGRNTTFAKGSRGPQSRWEPSRAAWHDNGTERFGIEARPRYAPAGRMRALRCIR